jgi:amidase
MSVHWKERVADKRRRQQEAIPDDWRISAPGADVLNVTAVPENCGLLSAEELEITNTADVAILLEKLASGAWSSVQVTTAFYKRAIVAQQLVMRQSSSSVVKAHTVG